MSSGPRFPELRTGLGPARAHRAPPGARRSWVWRAAATFTALLVCGVLVVAGPGSVQIVRHRHAIDSSTAIRTPSWTRPCYGHIQDSDHPQLAFCARIDGRVIYSDATAASGETHLLVVGGFHLVLVELRAGSRRPAWGSRITAVGPLLRARDGEREVQAVWVGGA